MAREGWKIVGLTRLSPVFPFNLLNYAFGFTQVSLRDYFLASWIGMMPGTFMYVYVGSLTGDPATRGKAGAHACKMGALQRGLNRRHCHGVQRRLTGGRRAHPERG